MLIRMKGATKKDHGDEYRRGICALLPFLAPSWATNKLGMQAPETCPHKTPGLFDIHDRRPLQVPKPTSALAGRPGGRAPYLSLDTCIYPVPPYRRSLYKARESESISTWRGGVRCGVGVWRSQGSVAHPASLPCSRDA